MTDKEITAAQTRAYVTTPGNEVYTFASVQEGPFRGRIPSRVMKGKVRPLAEGKEPYTVVVELDIEGEDQPISIQTEFLYPTIYDAITAGSYIYDTLTADLKHNLQAFQLSCGAPTRGGT